MAWRCPASGNQVKGCDWGYGAGISGNDGTPPERGAARLGMGGIRAGRPNTTVAQGCEGGCHTLGGGRNAMGDDQRPKVGSNWAVRGYGSYPSTRESYPSTREIELVSQVVHLGPDGVAAALPQFRNCRTGKQVETNGVRALVVCLAEQMHGRDRLAP